MTDGRPRATPFEEQHVLLYLGMLIDKAQELMLDTPVRDHLRPSQFRVIVMVPYDGAITVTELATRVGMTKQAVGQFVTGLVESGHLVTEQATHDRRLRVVRRTERGNEVAMEMAKRLEMLEMRWAEQVGERRYDQFRDTLVRLALG